MYLKRILKKKIKDSRRCIFIDIYYLMINIITKGTLIDEKNTEVKDEEV